LAEETIRKTLTDYGLTEKEAEVYVFLAKQGALKGGDLANRLRVNKSQIYHILGRLQTKGLVESTLESPTRFTAVPFSTVLDSYIKARRGEAAQIESSRESLLQYWEKISRAGSEPRLERFVVIEGNRRIYPRISQMMKEAKQRFSVVTPVAGLVRGDQFGLIDAALHHPLRSKVEFRYITEVSDQNIAAMKALLSRKRKSSFNFSGRNPSLGLSLSPRMMIKDDEEILFFITAKIK
jgi:sugar-specific transcriptional regulator TrmB